jgi:two-component system phosphate regulon response regulator PhoB
MNKSVAASAQTSSTPVRVLIAEDDCGLAEMLSYNLKSAGFATECVDRGDEAERRLGKGSYDLVILDWVLPGVSGLEICRRLRENEITRFLPVIMLTARGEENERVRGLSAGADDYVVKHFSVLELIARVRALLRRRPPQRLALAVGDIHLDRETMRVRRGVRDVRLRPIEFRILAYLIARKGRVLSRSQLRDGVWGQRSEISERTIDVNVARLRHALSRDHERDPVRTVPAVGYSFDET